MSEIYWNDWLHAQRAWATLAKHGYLHHTPESVFFNKQRRPLLALEYTTEVWRVQTN